MIMLELGRKDRLTKAQAKLAAAALKRNAARFTAVDLGLYGFRSDPRGLWDIPEASSFIRRVAALAGIEDIHSPLVQNLTREALALLVLCDALGNDHGLNVTVEQMH